LNPLLLAAPLAFLASSALAQEKIARPPDISGRDQTFREIGRGLEEISRSLSPQTTDRAGQMSGGSQTLSFGAGTDVTAKTAVTGLVEPSPTAEAAGTIAPGTRVQVQGVEKGFVQVVPYEGSASGKKLFIPQGTAQATLQDYVNTRMIEMMDQVKRLASSLENNPYVRLKGFKVNVSVSPSLDVEFEMKGSEATSIAPSSAITPLR
jgi:hypothetical protein